ncbi:hypothetical protein NLO95_18245 [Pseudomonas syringae]|nr:hypothetical protein [Pseudomonas syringae]
MTEQVTYQLSCRGDKSAFKTRIEAVVVVSLDGRVGESEQTGGVFVQALAWLGNLFLSALTILGPAYQMHPKKFHSPQPTALLADQFYRGSST